jgi:GTPase SAR1 family protein
VINRNYFQNATVGMFVFDVTNKETLENLRGWIAEVKNCAPTKAQFIIVGNKMDDFSGRQVSFEDGRKMADDYGASYFEVSAKEGLRINQVFFFGLKKSCLRTH